MTWPTSPLNLILVFVEGGLLFWQTPEGNWVKKLNFDSTTIDSPEPSSIDGLHADCIVLLAHGHTAVKLDISSSRCLKLNVEYRCPRKIGVCEKRRVNTI